MRKRKAVERQAKRVVAIVAIEGTPGDEVCQAIAHFTILHRYRLETIWETVDSRSAAANCEIVCEGQDIIHLRLRILSEKDFRELLDIQKSIISPNRTLFLDVNPGNDIHPDCAALVLLVEHVKVDEESHERAENILLDYVLPA